MQNVERKGRDERPFLMFHVIAVISIDMTAGQQENILCAPA